ARSAHENGNHWDVPPQRVDQLSTDVVVRIAQTREAVESGRSRPRWPDDSQDGIAAIEFGPDSGHEVGAGRHGLDVLEHMFGAESGSQSVAQTAGVASAVASAIAQKDAHGR